MGWYPYQSNLSQQSELFFVIDLSNWWGFGKRHWIEEKNHERSLRLN